MRAAVARAPARRGAWRRRRARAAAGRRPGRRGDDRFVGEAVLTAAAGRRAAVATGSVPNGVVGVTGGRCRRRRSRPRPSVALARSAGVSPAARPRTGQQSGGTSASSGQRRLPLAGHQRDLAVVRRAAGRGCSCTSLGLDRRLPPSRRMRGRMNTIRLVLVLSTRGSGTGRRAPGCCRAPAPAASVSRTSSEIRPPSTMHAAVVDQHAGVIVRLLVTRSVARDLPGCAAMLEASCEIFRSTVSPLGDLRRDLEDDADFLALDGLERIDRAAAGRRRVGVLAGDERHLLGDLDLRLLVVEGDDRGLDTMLVLPWPPIARSSAAQLKPSATIWPTPMVRPLGTAGDAVGVQDALQDLPDPGAVDRLHEAAGGQQVAVGVAVADHPVDAEVHGLVERHLDQDGLDQHLGAADVEAVDDGHQRAHDLGRCGHDEGVGLAAPPRS